MNIIISPYDRKGFICRPDSTLLRAITEYFLPDYVKEISLSPIFFIKTHRAGKAISPRFVERYIEGVGYGLLLYPKIEYQDSLIPFTDPFIENSLDYTSIIPLGLSPLLPQPLGEKPPYQVFVDEKNPFQVLTLPDKEFVFNKISEISKYCSIRIGDFIAFELAPHYPIPVPSIIQGIESEKELFQFKVK